MTLEIILVAIVLILCIAADKFSGKFGMPALILFIGIGMLFGCDGIAGIEFDNFRATEYICNILIRNGKLQSRLLLKRYCYLPVVYY